MCHMYGWWFYCLPIIKCNALHRNGLTARELLWVNLFSKYLTYSIIIMSASSVKIVLFNQKHAIPFTCKMITPKYVNMWHIKSHFFHFLCDILNENIIFYFFLLDYHSWKNQYMNTVQVYMGLLLSKSSMILLMF